MFPLLPIDHLGWTQEIFRSCHSLVTKILVCGSFELVGNDMLWTICALRKYSELQNRRAMSTVTGTNFIRSLDYIGVATMIFIHPYSLVQIMANFNHSKSASQVSPCLRQFQDSNASSLTISFLPFGGAVYASSCSIPSSSTMTVRKLVQITAAICFI